MNFADQHAERMGRAKPPAEHDETRSRWAGVFKLGDMPVMTRAAYIKKIGPNKWRVYSESGKNMGTYDSEAGAKNRLKQVEYFKHKGQYAQHCRQQLVAVAKARGLHIDAQALDYFMIWPPHELNAAEDKWLAEVANEGKRYILRADTEEEIVPMSADFIEKLLHDPDADLSAFEVKPLFEDRRKLAVNINDDGDWEKQEMSDVEMPSGFSNDQLANMEPGAGPDRPGTEKDFGRDRPRHFDIGNRRRRRNRYPVRGHTVKLAQDVWVKTNDLYAIRNGTEENGYVKIPRGSMGVVTAILPGVERAGRSIQVKFGNGHEAVFTTGRGYADPRTFLRRAVRDGKQKADCFGNVYRWALTHLDAEGAKVIHGHVTSGDGQRIYHAWIERGGLVIDPTTDVEMDKKRFYELVDAAPQASYEPRQVIMNALRSRHMGPWSGERTAQSESFSFDPNSTANEGRYRLRDPSEFDQDTFRRWNRWPKPHPQAWGPLPDGITFIGGMHLQTKQPEIQTVRFNKRLWDESKAANFLSQHPELQRVSTGSFKIKMAQEEQQEELDFGLTQDEEAREKEIKYGKPYNGWTNWATWNVNLWFQNDEGLYNHLQDELHGLTRGELTGDVVETITREAMPEGTPDFRCTAEELWGTGNTGPTGADVYDMVDWDDIAESWYESFTDDFADPGEPPVQAMLKRAQNDSVEEIIYMDEWDERIPGGRAEGMAPADFDSEQLSMGINVELEHVDDLYTACEIAMDHLAELSDYYTRLVKMEAEDGMAKEGQQYVDYSSGGAFTNKLPRGQTINMQVPPNLATQYKTTQISGNIMSYEGPGKYKVKVPGEQTMLGQETDILVVDDTYAKPDHVSYPKVSTTSVIAPVQPVRFSTVGQIKHLTVQL